MVIKGNTVENTWYKSIKRLMSTENIVQTERNIDAKEEQNVTIIVRSPLSKPKKAFNTNDNFDLHHKAMESYWKSVNERIRYFENGSQSINQYEYVVRTLKSSKYSRRAYLSIWHPMKDVNSVYPFCIIGLNLLIRDNRLNMTAILRSNDAWGQALQDMKSLILIQSDIANTIGIDVGTYTHFAMSYHIYMNDIIAVENYLSKE